MVVSCLALGILSWCLACIAIGKRGSYGACIASFTCCCASLWLALKNLDWMLNIKEDTVAAMDTVGGFLFGAAVLSTVTVALNGIAFLRGRKQ